MYIYIYIYNDVLTIFEVLAEVSTASRMTLADAQTSGGLLIGVRKAEADRLVLQKRDKGGL